MLRSSISDRILVLPTQRSRRRKSLSNSGSSLSQQQPPPATAPLQGAPNATFDWRQPLYSTNHLVRTSSPGPTVVPAATPPPVLATPTSGTSRASFAIGERVVVLNGSSGTPQHGRVLYLDEGRGVKIQLDLWNPAEESQLWVQPQFVQREPKSMLFGSRHSTLVAAPCRLGRLQGAHEEAFQFLLQQLRTVVTTFFLGGKRGRQFQLKGGAAAGGEDGMDSLYKRCQLTPLVWRQWDQTCQNPSSSSSSSTVSGDHSFGDETQAAGNTSSSKRNSRRVYMVLKRYLTEHMLYSKRHGLSKEAYKLVWEALEDNTVANWSTRVHAVFWVVGEASDGSGVYLVPDSNHDVVYKALSGDPSLLHIHLAKRTYQRPIQLQLTLLNWYGRLVTDGSVSTGRRPGPPRTVLTADGGLTKELRQTVFDAVDHKRMITKLVQLENSSKSKRRCPRSWMGLRPKSNSSRSSRSLPAPPKKHPPVGVEEEGSSPNTVSTAESLSLDTSRHSSVTLQSLMQDDLDNDGDDESSFFVSFGDGTSPPHEQDQQQQPQVRFDAVCYDEEEVASLASPRQEQQHAAKERLLVEYFKDTEPTMHLGSW